MTSRIAAAEPLFHIASVHDWAAPGELYRPSGFDEESFIHCATREQVVRVATRFAGRSDVVLLVIDPARVAAEIRYENLEGGTELYPHLYGSLERSAVIAVERLEP